MPYRFKGKPKLSNKTIIQLFKDGIYKVDLEEGVVYGKKGSPLKVKLSGRDESRPWIRLYHNGLERELLLSHAVWLAGSGRDIPQGFEIHHKDMNAQHNWWDNLFCLCEPDHRKLHRVGTLIDNQDEEETPF